MFPKDEEKTSFITDQGIYYYKVMPFGLKNEGATYQQLVSLIFRPLIRKNIEVYVDGLLVKSIQEVDHLQHLSEAFSIIKSSR